MSRPRDVIEAFQAVAREEILRTVSADSCIFSTRVACATLRRFDLEVQPLVVEAFIFNRAFLERVEAEGRWPEGGEEVRAWSKQYGVWSIGLGQRDRPASGPRKWPGHLVAVVERAWLVDASLDQASRPAHDIELPGVVVQPVEEGFLQGSDDLGLWSEERGLFVLYRAYPRVTDYRRAPDWKRVGRCQGAADRIERRMRTAMR